MSLSGYFSTASPARLTSILLGDLQGLIVSINITDCSCAHTSTHMHSDTYSAHLSAVMSHLRYRCGALVLRRKHLNLMAANLMVPSSAVSWSEDYSATFTIASPVAAEQSKEQIQQFVEDKS